MRHPTGAGRMLGPARRPGLVRRRPAVLVVLAALLLTMLLGSALGRAEPTGNYRPELVPDALTTGC